MAAYLPPFAQAPDFMDEETEAQGGRATLPGSHRGVVVGSAQPPSTRLVPSFPALLEPSCVGALCEIFREGEACEIQLPPYRPDRE